MLEFTEKEKSRLNDWISDSIKNKDVPVEEEVWKAGSKVKVIFDTDIGTDIDDALALLMLLHLPKEDVELLGVTTVYGYTHIRQRVAQSIMDAYEDGIGITDIKDKIPVISGESIPIGTHRNIWHTMTEGVPLFQLKEIDEMKEIPPGTKEDRYQAANFIISQVLKYPNEVVLIGLGALSNIAIALSKEPKLPSLVKRFVYMGMGNRMKSSQTELYPFKAPTEANFEPGFPYFFFPNHNISCDTVAAVKAFESEFSDTFVINDTVTNKLWFDGETVQSIIKSTGPPENIVVGKLFGCWLYYRSSIFYRDVTGTCPHDALTVAEAIYPGRFVKYARGHIMIHEWAGFPTFVLDPKGPHRIGVEVKNTEFLEFFGKALLSKQ